MRFHALMHTLRTSVMPLRTARSRAPPARCGFETSTTNCWREACRTYLIASATSGAQSDVDACRLTGRSQRTRQRGAGGTRSVARCARASLTTRFRAVSVPGHRRLDAWSVERAGRSSQRVSLVARHGPTSPRERSLRRLATQPASVRDAVRDELGDQMLRAASGYSRSGSLSHWLASAPHPVIGLVTAEAVNWATQLQEIAEWLDATWEVPTSDAYYDVASARTTLRARRDLVVRTSESRPSFAFVVDHRARVPDRVARRSHD